MFCKYAQNTSKILAANCTSTLKLLPSYLESPAFFILNTPEIVYSTFYSCLAMVESESENVL